MPGIPEGSLGSIVQANAGDGIVVFVNDLRNVYQDPEAQTVDVYTSNSTLPPSINIALTNNQILFVFKSLTDSQHYEILVTIEPQ